jgi:hypothetical protein
MAAKLAKVLAQIAKDVSKACAAHAEILGQKKSGVATTPDLDIGASSMTRCLMS